MVSVPRLTGIRRATLTIATAAFGAAVLLGSACNLYGRWDKFAYAMRHNLPVLWRILGPAA